MSRRSVTFLAVKLPPRPLVEELASPVRFGLTDVTSNATSADVGIGACAESTAAQRTRVATIARMAMCTWKFRSHISWMHDEPGRTAPAREPHRTGLRAPFRHLAVQCRPGADAGARRNPAGAERRPIACGRKTRRHVDHAPVDQEGRAVVLRTHDNRLMPAGSRAWFDKVPLRFTGYTEEQFRQDGFRVVPPATV